MDGSIEMAVRSKKPKAVALVKWLSKKGIEKIQEEHQQAITDRDNQIQAHQHKILRLNKKRVNTYYLVSIKTLGLVYVRR